MKKRGTRSNASTPNGSTFEIPTAYHRSVRMCKNEKCVRKSYRAERQHGHVICLTTVIGAPGEGVNILCVRNAKNARHREYWHTHEFRSTDMQSRECRQKELRDSLPPKELTGLPTTTQCGLQEHQTKKTTNISHRNIGVAILAQDVVGYPRRLERRWHNILFKQLLVCELSLMALRCL